MERNKVSSYINNHSLGIHRLLEGIIWCLLLVGCNREAVAETNFPATLVDLDKWYVEPPTNENAAIYFLRGFSELKFSKSDRELPWLGWAQAPRPGDSVPPEMSIAISNLVNRNLSALANFQKGASYTQSRYPYDFTENIIGQERNQSVNISSMYATDFLSLHTLWLANAGRGSDASEIASVNFGLARSLGMEPVLGSQVRRSQCIVTAIESFEQIFNRSVVTPAMLDKLKTIILQLEVFDASGTSFIRGIVGDQIKIGHFFDVSDEKLFCEWISVLKTMSHEEFKKYPKAAEREFVDELFKQLLTAWRNSYPERLAEVQNLCSARERLAKDKGFFLGLHLSQRFPSDAEHEAVSLAYLRLGITAIALEQFRAVRHYYPQALDELKNEYLPAIPIDPFDGRNVRYLKSDKGYVIYSVGPDLVDNSGNRRIGLGGDIVFQVVVPSKSNSRQ